MKQQLEGIVVFLIVLAAAVYVVRRAYLALRHRSGCSNCPRRNTCGKK